MSTNLYGGVTPGVIDKVGAIKIREEKNMYTLGLFKSQNAVVATCEAVNDNNGELMGE